MENKDTSNIDNSLLIQIFIEVDDFIKHFYTWRENHILATENVVKKQTFYQKPSLSESEIVTLCIYYHLSGYKNFEYYYRRLVLPFMGTYFPKLVSYNRFVELQSRCAELMYFFAQFRCLSNPNTGLYVIDSKKIVVCLNQRINANKVFSGIATRGKSSTGWFFGFKIHLIINHLGDIVRFGITAANIADNNVELLTQLFKRLKGKVFGDKGYISRFFESFYENGVQIVTKIRKNMKNKIMDIQDKLLLRKRAVIEAVNDILCTVCDIEHSRHRSPVNAMLNICAAVAAYDFLPNKPKIILDKIGCN